LRWLSLPFLSVKWSVTSGVMPSVRLRTKMLGCSFGVAEIKVPIKRGTSAFFRLRVKYSSPFEPVNWFLMLIHNA
jgi:hypothetical protein